MLAFDFRLTHFNRNRQLTCYISLFNASINDYLCSLVYLLSKFNNIECLHSTLDFNRNRQLTC